MIAAAEPPAGIERLLAALAALWHAGRQLAALAPSRWLAWLLDPSGWP